MAEEHKQGDKVKIDRIKEEIPPPPPPQKQSDQSKTSKEDKK